MEQSINTAAVLTAVSRMGDQDTLNLLPPSAAIMWSPTISNVLSGVLSGELSSVALDELMHSLLDTTSSRNVYMRRKIDSTINDGV